MAHTGQWCTSELSLVIFTPKDIFVPPKIAGQVSYSSRPNVSLSLRLRLTYIHSVPVFSFMQNTAHEAGRAQRAEKETGKLQLVALIKKKLNNQSRSGCSTFFFSWRTETRKRKSPRWPSSPIIRRYWKIDTLCNRFYRQQVTQGGKGKWFFLI